MMMRIHYTRHNIKDDQILSGCKIWLKNVPMTKVIKPGTVK